MIALEEREREYWRMGRGYGEELAIERRGLEAQKGGSCGARQRFDAQGGEGGDVGSTSRVGRGKGNGGTPRCALSVIVPGLLSASAIPTILNQSAFRSLGLFRLFSN